MTKCKAKCSSQRQIWQLSVVPHSGIIFWLQLKACPLTVHRLPFLSGEATTINITPYNLANKKKKERNVIMDTFPKNEISWLSVPQNVLANHGASQCLNNYFTVYCSQVHIFKRRNDRVVLITVSQCIRTHSFSDCEYSSGNRTLCFMHKCSSSRHELTFKLSSPFQRRVFTHYLSI